MRNLHGVYGQRIGSVLVNLQLVVVPWQDWSVLRSPLPRLPLLDPPSFTYDWVSSASFIIRFVFHFRPFPFLDLPSFTHGLALLDDILVSCLIPRGSLTAVRRAALERNIRERCGIVCNGTGVAATHCSLRPVMSSMDARLGFPIQLRKEIPWSLMELVTIKMSFSDSLKAMRSSSNEILSTTGMRSSFTQPTVSGAAIKKTRSRKGNGRDAWELANGNSSYSTLPPMPSGFAGSAWCNPANYKLLEKLEHLACIPEGHERRASQ